MTSSESRESTVCDGAYVAITIDPHYADWLAAIQSPQEPDGARLVTPRAPDVPAPQVEKREGLRLPLLPPGVWDSARFVGAKPNGERWESYDAWARDNAGRLRAADDYLAALAREGA